MSELELIPEVEAHFKKRGPIATEIEAVQAPRVVVWFSCGAASAVAGKLTLAAHPTAQLVYCDMGKDEHSDNVRFRGDVERWLGVSVTLLSHPRYKSVREVFARERYMSGVAGAKCTVEMKKKPRFAWQRPDDVHVFGFTLDETMPLCKNPLKDRIGLMEKNNPELRLWWPLRDQGVTKDDCYRIVKEAGIELPAMYRLGFKNNNCIGCVKSQSPAYWNKIRQHFPEVFEDRAEQSRAIGCRLIKIKGVRTFLDELPAACTEDLKEDLSCGPQCASAAA